MRLNLFQYQPLEHTVPFAIHHSKYTFPIHKSATSWQQPEKKRTINEMSETQAKEALQIVIDEINSFEAERATKKAKIAL